MKPITVDYGMINMSEKEFRIVEGNDDFLEKVPEFVRLYNNHDIKIVDLRKRLNISRGLYRRLLKYCVDEKLLTLRRQGRNVKKPHTPTYITRSINNGKECYMISKTINMVEHYFCKTYDYKTAERIVELLKDCEWDKNELPRIKKAVGLV